MSNLVTSKQLRAQLEALDSELGLAEGHGSHVPAPRKINEGNDRYGGYP